jgi:type I restriction enzyme S subunit
MLKLLGDVCLVKRGTTITQKEATQGNIPVIAGGLKPTYFHNVSNRQGNVITISGSGANAGFVNFWDEPIFASDCSTVEVKRDDLSIQFVYYYLLSQQDFIYKELRSGAAQPHVYGKDIAKLLMPFPSLATQQKIVAKLEAIFSEIDIAVLATEANVKNSETLFQKYLTEIFETNADDWKNVKLKDVVKEVVTGPFGSALHKSDYVDVGVPVVNPQNLVNGKIIPLSKTMVSLETKERLKKYCLKSKDILIARRGEMGRCGLVDSETEGWLCGTGSMIIRLNERANEYFIFRLLQSNRVKQELERSSIGATMNNLNQSILLDIQFSLPPLEFQIKTLEAIKEFSKKKIEISELFLKKKIKLESLRKSILKQAFNGELVKD